MATAPCTTCRPSQEVEEGKWMPTDAMAAWDAKKTANLGKADVSCLRG